MTSLEGAPPQIYVPTLHKELIGRPLPDGVLLVDPGLPHTGGADQLFTPGDYPLSGDTAAHALSELLSMGEGLDLSNPRNADLARAAFPASTLSPEEARALAGFTARTGGEPPVNGLSPLVSAQKVLLLAWDLETRLADIHKLRQEVTQTALPLARALRDPSSGEAFPGSVSEFLPDIPDNAEPDWRLILTAMAAFLPEDAFWVTAHEGIRNTLLELGMLLPLPEDTATRLENWPDSLKAALLWTKTPLWRVLGHAKLAKNTPWLAKAPEIIVCSPKKKKAA